MEFMDVRQLRYFLAVAEEGHITRAAEKLQMQQPPLSRQIRALEKDLDVQLFRRKPRGVELTKAGEALLADARVILNLLEHAYMSARRAERGEVGRLAVGFTTSAPFHPLVPRIIRAFREGFPLVSLTLEENGSIELIDGLLEEKLDAAFIRTPVSKQDGIVARSLFEEAMVIALPQGHSLARKDRKASAGLSLKSLSQELFVSYRRPSGPGLYDSVIAACHAAGFSPRIGQDAPRMSSTLNLVAAGIGISIVPESLRRMNMDGVVYRPLKDAYPKAPMYLAARRNDSSAILKHFLNLTRTMSKSF